MAGLCAESLAEVVAQRDAGRDGGRSEGAGGEVPPHPARQRRSEGIMTRAANGGASDDLTEHGRQLLREIGDDEGTS